ncbi:minor capsid protein [Fusobacterium necrophorum]|uniref:minor capsid protein n=1 Tax=Fusobacterium necrophorum TaxID=859 RepID=UPI0025503631|nr:minor capsid protein [Fusobacterium necrophorum]MDK4472292.1 minor capsid protein [Fusobacterium necrophorum]MDK4479290.1 minor capsid protein [Fusobacterium necrophorum]MDK4517999.1 minor capsid protein [Fusobacterium necrophorum]
MVEMNKNYWQERQHKREAKAYSKILDVEKEYKEALERSKININKQISHIGTTYMKDNQLSYAEAMRQLKGAEYKVWRKELHEYMQEWKKLEKEAPLEAKKLWLEIETLSARSRISHLDTIRAQIDIELSKVSTEAVESTRKALYGVYGDTYKEVVGDLGVKSMFSNEIAKAVIDRPWSGANYSSRLWGNSERLARVLKQEVTTGMIQGINLKTMGKRISDKIEGAKKNDVERLLRTEVNYTLNQATLDGYKDAKVEKYEFDATLDSRTSQICAELNGEVFEVNKTAVGVNYPPMHPRCRSTTSPIIDYEVLGKRLREEKEQKEIVSESSFSKQVKESIEKELGKLNTDSVILRKERLQHIEERHPEAVEIIKNNFDKIIENPDYVLKDGKNENTILLIRELESKAYNTVIKISVKENTELKNSTLTFYKIRDREVRRLCNISKVILTKK